MPRFVVGKVEVFNVAFRKIKVVKTVFSRAKRGSAIKIARSDENFHQGIDDHSAAKSLEKARNAKCIVGPKVPPMIRLWTKTRVLNEREASV